MSRYDRQDIMIELIELCLELKSEILQQLNYFRASVYKNEAAAVIEQKLQAFRLIADLINNVELKDAFHDFELMKKSGPMMAAPGECLLSLSVTRLNQTTDRIFAELLSKIPQNDLKQTADFSQNVQDHRLQLLSACPQG
ncbi:MAG: hypothetical protein NTX25_12550, partial [Proteobacteria bacterium]|nr:hypothetical protein [Pseudomonadota bacterium]